VTPVRSLFGAQWRSVLLTVCTPREPSSPAELRVAIHLASDNGGDSTAPRVHRQPIQDHRHTDGGASTTHSGSPTHRWCTSEQEIADIISEETGRDVRYQYINQEEWTRQLKAAAVHSGGLVNDAMIQHLPTHARTMADNTTIAARMDTDPSALAAASGRPPLTFRNFVRQHRSAFGAVTANA
jgi:hypothetical protein